MKHSRTKKGIKTHLKKGNIEIDPSMSVTFIDMVTRVLVYAYGRIKKGSVKPTKNHKF
jgi:hypothetical protein